MDYLQVIFAALPVIGLILALGVFRVPAHLATAGSLILTFLLAIFVWGMDPLWAASAAGEGGAIAIWPIMLVIVAAIFTYQVAIKTGSLDIIKTMLVRISADRRIQVLILAWGFGGFLEAVAGYGTAVAIPASILAVLGFEPIFAAVICLIANTVPTAFGSVGIPVSTLAQITGLNVGTLSLAVGLQLTFFIVLIPFALVMMTGRQGGDGNEKRLIRGFGALKGVMGITLASGLSFAVPQLLAAAFLGAELPALLGSVTSLTVTVLLARRIKQPTENPNGLAVGQDSASTMIITTRIALKAWLPYLLIFAFILVSSPLVPPVYHALSGIASKLTLYLGPDAKPTLFKWIATPGILIILATLIGGSIQGLKPRAALATFGATLWKLKESALTVVCILAMAKIMDHGGMVATLAGFLVSTTGSVYPLISGLMGTLGTFVTGSDTSSNILFGNLQVEIAHRTGIDPYWLAAANTAGATAGKMISPQSIAVATSATGLIGREGDILQRTILFCVGYVLILGLLVWGLSPFVHFG